MGRVRFGVPVAEMRVEIDHVFVFVEPGGAALEYLRSLGLVETYRRTHRGQGTENICFCFDNMFLECIWVCDVDAVRGDVVARTGLYERSLWRDAGSCPFGIAWREGGDGVRFETETWGYRPPYLTEGMAIDVSIDGDDVRQPMMFRSPGGSAPVDWAAERRGGLQRAAGLGRVLGLRLELARGVEPCATLLALGRGTLLDVACGEEVFPRLTCEVERVGRDEALVIRLPVSVFVESIAGDMPLTNSDA